MDAQPPTSYKESPSHFKASDWKVASPSDTLRRDGWWKIFKDPELDALESQLNINDQNIKQFLQNYMEARALVRQAAANFYPSVTFNASWLRSLSPGGGGSGGGGSSTTSSSSSTSSSSGSKSLGASTGTSGSGTGMAGASTGKAASASSKMASASSSSSSSSSTGGSVGRMPIVTALTELDASWEPDLWGRVMNQVRAARYTAQASAADLENERLSEQASLAMMYFQLRGQDALQQVLNDTVVADKKALDYNEAQFETGITDRISVVEAQNTLQNAQATATNIGVLRAQYEHAIAVLCGRVASNFSIPPRALKAIPPPIPLGIPSELIQRRPDVASAERAMAAANANIGMAYAAYFPTFSISTSGGFDSNNIRSLWDVHNGFWSVGPSVTEPILEGGLRRATVRQFVATYNADLAAYRQTVLTSFQQVEDSLSQVRILSTQYLQQRAAEDSGKTFLKLEMARFQTGIDPYVDVVTAQTTLLTDQVAVINVQVQAMTGAVGLIKALGGGWDKTKLPTPAEVNKWTKHSEAVKLP
jgi:NodT family efflux transporter outer membrane factor (OMF) lipoprotein